MLGVGFAYLSMKNNERFEFSTFSNDLNPVRARRGMGHLAQIVDYLNSLKMKGNSQFKEMMMQYKENIGSKSMVIIISDFLFDPDEIKEGIYLFKNHDLRVIQVLDKEESELNIEGDLKLKDSESDTVMRTYITKRLRQEYVEELSEHSAKIKEIVTSLGGKFYVTTTAEDVFDSFYAMLA
jgi:uncharacterized protein (DUF58 family)